MDEQELNARQLGFVREYIVDGNGTQAAIRAGYSARTAYSQACRLLKNAKVQEAVAELREQAAGGKVMALQEAMELLTAEARREGVEEVGPVEAARLRIKAIETLAKLQGWEKPSGPGVMITVASIGDMRVYRRGGET